MKKILLATSALVATAGFASAEIKLTGMAEMGVFGADETNLQFHNDFTINIDGKGETDSGLSFGFHIELEDNGDASQINGGAYYDNEAVWLSGSFGKLTLGETDGAYDWAMEEIGWGSAIADDHTTHAGYNGNSGLDSYYDNQVMRYEYSFGDFAAAFSLEMCGDGYLDDLKTASYSASCSGSHDPVIGVGLKYSGEFAGFDLTLGGGYQTVDSDFGEADIAGFSVGTQFGPFAAIFNYSHFETDVDDDVSYVSSSTVDYDHYGLGIAYIQDALTLEANYGYFDVSGRNIDGDKIGDPEGWGVAANYDLGGGAVLEAGYGISSGWNYSDGSDSLPPGWYEFDDTETYSLGIKIKF